MARRLSSTIVLNYSTTPAAYGTAMDVSRFQRWSVLSLGAGGWVGSWTVIGFADLAAYTLGNVSIGSALTGTSAHVSWNYPTNPVIRAIKLLCNSYTSGAPAFVLVGEHYT